MLKGNLTALTPDVPFDAWNWRNDREVWDYCRQHTLITSGQQSQWLQSVSDNPQIKMFGIAELGKNMRSVGVCGLTSINRVNQTAEFSLYIGPEHRKKGYARDALLTLLRHGFFDHNLNRIWGEVFDGNPALNVFIAMGMQLEGTLRESYFRRGKFISSRVVSILRREFESRYP